VGYHPVTQGRECLIRQAAPAKESDVDLNAIKQQLEERRTELLDKQKRLARHTRHREEPLPQDFAEQAVELENQEVLEALDREVTDELRKLARALQRVDSGEYPYCSACGDEIPVGRLNAIPTTDHCIRCAAAAERR
jgi:DnaK suppressor protein